MAATPLRHAAKRLRATAIMILTVAAMLPCAAEAQEDYRYAIGGGVGMTGYLGDANSSNLWLMPGWDLELLFRYHLNPRWDFKTNVYVGSLRGDSSKMTNMLPDGNAYKFSTTFYEAGETVEFHFFNFGIGESYRRLKRITPYIAAGAGLTLWRTEGKTGIAFNIPLGVGVKYKLSERLDLGFEFLMKKTFTDRLDGDQLKDPYGIKSSFMKNTDWYSTMTFTVSYDFSRRCAACNYKE